MSCPSPEESSRFSNRSFSSAGSQQKGPGLADVRVLVSAFRAATHRRLELLFFGGVSVIISAVGIKMPFFQTEIALFLTVL